MLANSGLSDFKIDETMLYLNYYDHRIERLLRFRSTRKVLRLLAEDKPAGMREMSRLLRTAFDNIARGTRLLLSIGILHELDGQFYIRDGFLHSPINRTELVPQKLYTKTLDPLASDVEKCLGQQYLHAFIISGPHANGIATSDDKPSFIAIVRSTEPGQVRFVVDSLLASTRNMAVGAIAICTRDVWLRQLLSIRKQRSLILERGFDGIPLLGEKPQRHTLLDAMCEVTPPTPETIEDWKKKGYLREAEGKLQFTSHGMHFLKVKSPLFIRPKEENVSISGKVFHLIYD